MIDSLKTSHLFIERHLTVIEVGVQQNLDLKNDQSLSDLKKYEMVFKLTALN